MCYAGISLFWKSKLQSEIALSTCEAEHIALSMAMRELIPFMSFVKEIDSYFNIGYSVPLIKCRVWEDNQSCIAVATSQKAPLRTKHIALKYHFFRSYVIRKEVQIDHINTHLQLADILTKPVEDGQYFKLRYLLMGW